jgi:hypothetical protein
MTEMQRILALPQIDYADPVDCPEEPIQALFCRPDSQEGWRLRPQQIQAYYAVQQCGGGLLMLGVGAGKTLALHLMPKALGLDPADCLVLAKAKLIPEAQREVAMYQREFNLEPIEYMSFEKLSNAKQATYLDQRQPKAIFIDEAQWLSNKKATVSRRVLRYINDHQPAVVAASASLTKSSLHDFAHIAQMALGQLSPLPLSYDRLSAWAALIDSKRFGGQDGDYDIAHAWSLFAPLARDPRFAPGPDADTPTKKAREAFQKRLFSAPGIIVSAEAACNIPIDFVRVPYTPDPVVQAMAVGAKAGLHPDGWLIDSPALSAEVAREILTGFYYFYDWPDGVIDHEWLNAKSHLARMMSAFLARDRPQLDSPAMVKAAIEAGEELPEDLVFAYADWLYVADRSAPPQAVREINADYAQWAAARVAELEAEGRRVAVWHSNVYVGEMLERAGLRQAGADPHGACAESKSVVFSFAKHAVGLNLQYYFDTVLVLQPPANGPMYEQFIGRVHRPGNAAARILVQVVDRDVASLDRRAIQNALADAAYYTESMRSPQKIVDFELGKAFGIKGKSKAAEKSATKTQSALAKWKANR